MSTTNLPSLIQLDDAYFKYDDIKEISLEKIPEFELIGVCNETHKLCKYVVSSEEIVDRLCKTMTFETKHIYFICIVNVVLHSGNKITLFSNKDLYKANAKQKEYEKLMNIKISSKN